MSDEYLDASDIPHAAYFCIGRCASEQCRKPHLIMFNAQDKPILVADWPVDQPEALKKLQDLIYAFTVLHDRG